MTEPTTDSGAPTDDQPAPPLSAQVVDPKWVARVDYTSADGKVVSRVEAFAPSRAKLVPRSVFA